MAKSPVSEEELQLRKRARRRLIGAIALVLLAAIFLPMILEHEPKPSGENIDVQIPSSDGVTTPATPTPVAVPETPASASVATAPAVAPVPDAKAISKPATVTPAPKKTEAKKTEAKKAEAKKPAVKSEAKPKPATTSAATSEAAYVVQVAALSDATKAQNMRDQIKAAGVTVYTETVATASGKVTRVRAGPFKTKEEAEKAQAKLKGIGLNGNVVPK